MTTPAPFNQSPPRLANQYDDDRVLRSHLARALPPEMLAEIEPELRHLGGLAAGELFEMQRADRPNEPRLTSWDAWGERIDFVEVSPLWQRAERIAAEHGLVATAHERRHGEHSRMHQFALVHLFAPSSDVYTCPLAMTDGAVCTLEKSGNTALRERAIPHLTSRDPARFWTSGQWMTESIGGSDVGLSETVAEQDASGQWLLHGRKWFTSASTSPMALTLARPLGNGPGGHGLALFYVETRDEAGRLRNILVHRLKDKLGTRKVPTAELTLAGTPATLVDKPHGGVRAITPMLTITRTWNAVCAVAGMRRALALAVDFARRRVAFGAPLAEKALHVETLADLAAEYEAAFALTFFGVGLLGREEAGHADERSSRLHRLVTPLAKLVTGKQAVAVTSEALECFGGAGYVEDTGLPVLLRDAQVLPIWEGTTNVLALDVLRALSKEGGLDELAEEVRTCRDDARAAELREPAEAAVVAVDRARDWIERVTGEGPELVEAGARRFALSLGRSLALAQLCRHADWALAAGDRRPAAAARRFARLGVDRLAETPLEEARLLLA